MSFPENVAVVGLGLMGGSLAKDLSAAGVRVLGYDSRTGVAEEAFAAGDLAGILDESLADIALADLVVLATPVDSVGEILLRLKPLLGDRAVVTDVGSTKSTIVSIAEDAGLADVFVGSHPLAGDHRSGWGASRRGLYANALVYISPTRSSSRETISRVEALWSGLGATCSRISADEHDRLMSWVSHLPQVVSSAVALAMAESGCTPARLGPGGRDVTRLAASSPEMWTAIALSNEQPLLDAVETVKRRLESFQKALAERDVEAVRGFFASANDWTR